MWFWMYDTQVQGSEVTILLLTQNKLSIYFELVFAKQKYKHNRSKERAQVTM